MLTPTQIFTYQNNPISFDFEDGHGMINAAQMAKPFKKQPAHFLRLNQTKDFVNVLSFQISKNSHYANSHSEKIVKIQNGGRHQGTWMHEKLALKFAAWLSPEFELWVYDRIQELLLQGHTAIRETHPSPVKKETGLSQSQIEWRFECIERDLERLRSDAALGIAYIRVAMAYRRMADVHRYMKGFEKEVMTYDMMFAQNMDSAVDKLKKLE